MRQFFKALGVSVGCTDEALGRKTAVHLTINLLGSNRLRDPL